MARFDILHAVHGGINGLPNELLLKIVECIRAQESKLVNIPSTFSVLWALSRVNRRLRSVVLPSLLCQLKFRKFEELNAFLTRLVSGEENRLLVSSVRSIRIWRYIPPPSRVAFLPQESHGTMPFARLTEFECMVDYLDDFTLQVLSHCPTLRSLAVACVDDWDNCPLAFASLPDLETLRLNILTDSMKLSSTRTFNYSYPIRNYSSITTLALHTKPHFQTLIMELFETCYFPSLRVFLIQRYGADYVRLFQFVHRHATLLDINIDTNQRTQTRIRVEAIFKLFDGTGTWVPSTDPRASSAPFCYIGSNRESWVTNSQFPPNIIPDVPILCFSFAFTRASLCPEASSWNVEFGSPDPRFKCTGLTLDGLFQMPLHDYEQCHMLDVLQHLCFATPDLEELRVTVSDHTSTGDGVAWMRELVQTTLPNLKHLRKLAVLWDGDEPVWQDNPIDSYSRRYLPIFDKIAPELSWIDGRLKVKSLRERAEDFMKYNPHIYDPRAPLVIAVIKHALQLPEEEELDEHDGTLIMHTWETINTPRASAVIRELANACPLLEQFDWHLSSEDFPLPDIDGPGPFDSCGCAVWRWKFYRKESYREPVIINVLRWTGSIRGNPPPFYPLIGQELERALRLRDEAWAPYERSYI